MRSSQFRSLAATGCQHVITPMLSVVVPAHQAQQCRDKLADSLLVSVEDRLISMRVQHMLHQNIGMAATATGVKGVIDSSFEVDRLGRRSHFRGSVMQSGIPRPSLHAPVGSTRQQLAESGWDQPSPWPQTVQRRGILAAQTFCPQQFWQFCSRLTQTRAAPR